MSEQLRIGELAELLHRHPDTLRRYERAGLIPKARRDPYSKWRVWNAEEVEELVERLAPFEVEG